MDTIEQVARVPSHQRYCILFTVHFYQSFTIMCSSHYSLFIRLPQNDRAGSIVWVWRQVYVLTNLSRNTVARHIGKYTHDHFVWGSVICAYTHTHTRTPRSTFFPPSLIKNVQMFPTMWHSDNVIIQGQSCHHTFSAVWGNKSANQTFFFQPPYSHPIQYTSPKR